MGTVSVRVAVGGREVAGLDGFHASPVTVTFVAPPLPTFTAPLDGKAYELSELKTLSGTAEAGSVVQVSETRAGTLCTLTVGRTGRWSCDRTFDSPGVYRVSATATIDDRVYGPVAANFTVRNLPAPVILTANASVISGTATAGLSVRVVDQATGSPIGVAVIDSTGAWRMSTPEGIVSGDIAAQTVNQFDGVSAQTVAVLDADVPDRPVVAEAVGVRIDGTLPGTVDPGTVVIVTYPKAGSVGTIQAGAGADGSWSATLPDDAVSGIVSVVAKDPAGNSSLPVTLSIARPSVEVGMSSVVVGGTLVVSGVGWVPGESVQITVHSTPIDLGSVTARSDGTFPDVRFTVPEGFEPGIHRITATGTLSGTVENTFTVEAPVAVAPPQEKVSVPTGGAAAPGPDVAWLSVVLSAVGAGFLLLRRRRGDTWSPVAEGPRRDSFSAYASVSSCCAAGSAPSPESGEGSTGGSDAGRDGGAT